MIEIKLPLYGWKEVDREQAKNFVNHLIHHGCLFSQINNYLRGIAWEKLIEPRSNIKNVPLQTISQTTAIKFEIADVKESTLIKDCTVELEILARNQAFSRFLQNILFSLTVWQNDEKIRESLPSVTEWLNECIEIMNNMVKGDK